MSTHIKITIAAAMLLNLMTSFAHAANGKRGSVELTERQTWSDGKRTRSAWLDPELVAEWGSASQVTPVELGHGAEVVRSTPMMRIWRVSDENRRRAIARDPNRYGPVFRDGPSRRAPMRALPGGVIVHIAARNTRDAQVWAEQNRVEVAAPVLASRGYWLVKTQPGVAALTASSTLVAERRVSGAQPNWWIDLGAR